MKKPHFKRKTIKITLTALLCAANAYVLYAIIRCYFVWKKQPRFVLPDGSSTASMGFLITLFIYAGILLISAAALAVTGVFFFKKPKAALPLPPVLDSVLADAAKTDSIPA